SRLLFALGRAHMIDRRFGHVHPSYRSPSNAVVFVAAVSTLGIFLGRGVISPIVSMDSTCFIVLYMVVSIAMLRIRLTQPERNRPYRVPYGYLVASSSLAATGFMLIESLYLPFAHHSRK